MAAFVSHCWSTYPWSWFPSSSWSSGRPPRPSTPQHFHPSSGSRFIFQFNSTIISVNCFSSNARLISAVLGEYPELVGSDFADLNPQHGVEHFIKTAGPPVYAKPRRLDAHKLAIAKMLDLRLGFSPPYGPKAWWELATLQRLPTTQQCDHFLPVSCPQRSRFYPEV